MHRAHRTLLPTALGSSEAPAQAFVKQPVGEPPQMSQFLLVLFVVKNTQGMRITTSGSAFDLIALSQGAQLPTAMGGDCSLSLYSSVSDYQDQNNALLNTK